MCQVDIRRNVGIGYTVGMTEQETAGRRRLDPSQKARIAAWATVAAEKIEDRSLTLTDLARDLHVARSTLISWLAGETPPDPWRLGRIAEELSFPVDEQLELLGWRKRTESDDQSGGAGQLVLQLGRSIRELERASARVIDLAEASGEVVAQPAARVIDAVLTGGGERWKSLASTYRDGVRYPLLRETMVEFALRDGVKPLEWEELRTRYQSFVMERAPHLFLEDPNDDLARDLIKRERLELRSLIATIDRAWISDAGYFGEAGSRWESVCAMAKTVGGRRWSHLVNFSRTPYVGSATSQVLRGGSSRLILLVAPTYGTARVVGTLLAEALEWRDVPLERLTTMEWGRPRSELTGEERQRQLRETLARWIASPPATPTVLSVTSLDALASPTDPAASPAAAGITSASELEIVFVAPSLGVLRAWEQQQQDNAAFAGQVVRAGADRLTSLADTVLGLLRSTGRRIHEFPFEVGDIEPVGATNFRDPRINDEQVRIAWRILRELGVSPVPESELASFQSLLETDTDL